MICAAYVQQARPLLSRLSCIWEQMVSLDNVFIILAGFRRLTEFA
jgi:hypothetical protein